MTEVLFARLDEMVAGDASLQAQITAITGGLGTMASQNANNVAITGGSGLFTSALSLTKNQNANTTVAVSNSDPGAFVVASFNASNGGANFAGFGIGGTGGPVTGLTNRAYMYASSAIGGISLFSSGAGQSVDIYINSILSASFSATAGLLNLGLAGTSVGTIGFNNATSGTQTLAPVTGVLSGVASLPTGNYTITGNTLTQTLSNKTIAGASNTLSVRIANDVTGLGTGIATALGVNTGSAGAPVLFNGAGGTPTSISLASGTGLPISTGLIGAGVGILAALAVNVGTAGSPVINGGALGSPSSAGTIPAFTLGGTVAGGGNQINNVQIGASSPLAGSFTTLLASTSVSSPIHLSTGALQFQTNGGTFAGSITAAQQWFMSTVNNGIPTGPLLTVSKNGSTLPAIGTPSGISGTADLTMIIGGNDTNSVNMAMQSFNNVASGIRYLASGGTAASRTVYNGVGGTVGANFAYVYNGTAYVAQSGFIFTNTETTIDATHSGGRIDLYTTPLGTTGIVIGASIGNALMVGTTTDGSAGQIIMNNASFLMRNKTSWSNGAAASAGTLTNAPAIGNPTKWIPVDDNGTTRYVPAW